MKHLNAYPPEAINLKPLRNQTPESWKLKAAIAKAIYNHYGIPCWVYGILNKHIIKDKTYLHGLVSTSKDKEGNIYLYCGWYGYTKNDQTPFITLELEGYPDIILKIFEYPDPIKA